MATGSPPTDADLIDQIVDRQRRRAAGEAENAAAMLAYVDARRAAGRACAGGAGAGDLEATFAADELGLALSMPTATIQRQLARTRRIRARLPGVWGLWSDGHIDGYKVTKIDEAATRLVYGESLVRLDAEVVEVAPDRTPGQLQTWLNRFVARVEPDQVQQRYRRAFGDRTVYTCPDADGMGWFNLCHNQLDLAQIGARLDQLARALGADDPRTMDQRRADLAVDLLLGRIPDGAGDRTGTAATPANQAPTSIGVVVPFHTLIGDSEMPGQTLDGSAIVPADVVRERAVQPGTLFYRLLTDTGGNLLEVTESGRFPTNKLGFAISVRDGTSRFPTSAVPADRCDLDHTIAYSPETGGGKTTAANLEPLDRRTHNAKTHGALSLRQPRPGEFEWITSTGHTYTTKAEPLPITEWLDPASLPVADCPATDDLPPDDPRLDELADHHRTLPTDPEHDTWRDIPW